MNKKGFTLIELLAVIVILAVIALITVPAVMNVVTDAKVGAVKSSAYGYIEAIEYAASFTNNDIDLENDIALNGNFNDLTIPVKGTRPNLVSVELLNGEVSNGIMKFDTYLVIIENGKIADIYPGDMDIDDIRPLITLNGSDSINHQIGTPYIDLGASASDLVRGDVSDLIIVTNNININVAGTYQVVYEIDNGVLENSIKTRTVIVKDMIAPVITLNGNSIINHVAGSLYIDLGATAIDNIDGDITANITVTSNLISTAIGTYTTTYTVVDSSGNTSSISKTINVTDGEAPSVVFGTNGNTTYAKTRSIAVTVSDAGSGVNPSSLEYQWTTSTTAPSESSFTTAFTNGGIISSPVGVTGGYYLWILAKDYATNTMILRSNVFNLDNVNPVITISGANPYEITVGSSFVEPGRNATDNSGVTPTITNTTIPTASGSYTITYTATDQAGNTATATRTYYIWTAYSAWQDASITATGTRQVQTKLQQRYRTSSQQLVNTGTQVTTWGYPSCVTASSQWFAPVNPALPWGDTGPAVGNTYFYRANCTNYQTVWSGFTAWTDTASCGTDTSTTDYECKTQYRYRDR